MKLKKSFRYHSDLQIVKNNVETLLTYYKPDATIGDILKNVEENEAKWEECPKCHGTGVIRRDLHMLTGSKRTKTKTYGFCPCDKCKGKKWFRRKEK